MNDRLIHDAAVAMARAILDIIAPCIRPEERRDALEEFYTVCRSGIEAYEMQIDRMQKRLNPMKN